MTDITVSTAQGGTDLNVDVTKGTDLVLDVSIGNQITLAVDKGYTGQSGFSGYSGYSGYSGMSGSVYIGTSPPTTFGAGSMWWDDVAGKLKIYYVDQNGGQWVDSITGTAGASGYSGISGFSGYSGADGFVGSSGTSGYSGYSGFSGSGISGYSGKSGFSGYSGQQGTSITIKGEVATVGDLPPTGNLVNDAYIVTSDGDLWVWNGSAWFDAGQIVGPPGQSGISGFSGASGYSGYSGYSGATGTSGLSGYSGATGTSGLSGYSGINGTSGISGYSGFSGGTGSNGASGISGYSGYSGYSGETPASTTYLASSIALDPSYGTYVSGNLYGIQVFGDYSTSAGYYAWNDTATTPGFITYINFSSVTQFNQIQMNVLYTNTSNHTVYVDLYNNTSSAWDTFGFYNGLTGWTQFSYDVISGLPYLSGGNVQARLYHAPSGNPAHLTQLDYFVLVDSIGGAQGPRGQSGYSGKSGYSGYSGASGISGYSGYSGTQGQSSNLFLYMANTTATSGYPNDGDLLWNNATQTSATQINVAHLTDDGTDIEIFLSLLQQGESFVIQDQNSSENYQTWNISGAPVQTNWGTSTAYLAIPVTLVNSAGTGTTGFANAHPLFLAIVSGISGFSGFSGYSGASGYSGYSGLGISGYSGYSGAQGISGFSGATGESGFSGYSGSGISGYSGYSGSGISGYSGFSGQQGISGFSGISGTNGASGISGYSGYSGSGISGYSGANGASGISGYSGYSGSGISGYSGYSGAVGTSGFSGYSGTNGSDGASGFSGYSGTNGTNGASGISGYSGYSGSGVSGYSGYSGSGISGYSGFSGAQGISGFSGYSGIDGQSGFSGISGYSGFSGTGFAGGTLTSPLVASVSTTTNGTEPIRIQTGTVTTTPAAGTFEYDGVTMFTTPQAGNRGVIPSTHYITQLATYTTPTGTANTLKQLFNTTTNGAMTAAGNTTYFFECFFNLTAMSATSGTFQFGFLGTATFTNIVYLAIANKTALTVQTASSHTVGTAKTAVIISAGNTTTTGYAFIKGKIVVSTGGTIIPAFALSTAAAAVVQPGSYFQIWEAGTNLEVEIGNWT